ncbi:hypothetical protein [Nocardia panacis]|uniref:hypothetical protein n=1 Tax=Nocardia panacis TaxID=2340916 RepID=UPI0011C45101|nr:hypothetical protein [Nocardia panacis]
MVNRFDPETLVLLGRLSIAGTDSAVWEELWNELYHRHDSAVACAALPELAAIAAGGVPGDRYRAVSLAGALLAAADPYTAEIRDRYAEDICALLTEVGSELAAGGPAIDSEPVVFLDRVHAMLTFEDAAGWSHRLLELVEAELEIECPVCWAAMTMHIGASGSFTCTSGYPLDKVTKRQLIPANPDQLTGLGARLRRLAVAGRQATIARQLTFLFGHAVCTENGHEFTPADALAAMP